MTGVFARAAAPDIAAAAARSAADGLLFWAKISLVLVPVLVLYELLAGRPIFARWGRAIGPGLRAFGMSPAAVVPLCTGIVLGVVYGAGVLIGTRGDGRLTATDIRQIFVFLAVCHAAIEDTLLFALVGAPGPDQVALRMALLVAARLALALAVTAALARLIPRSAP